jgi:phage shock protein C
MQNVQPSLFARDDTFLGVCEGLGEDLGVNPLFLRLPLVPLLFFYPIAVIGFYLAAGAVVLATRLLFPDPAAPAADAAAQGVGNDNQVSLPLAA